MLDMIPIIINVVRILFKIIMQPHPPPMESGRCRDIQGDYQRGMEFQGVLKAGSTNSRFKTAQPLDDKHIETLVPSGTLQST